MNKYLEKLAELHPLQPGVNYDDVRHEIVLERNKVSDVKDRADRINRYIMGVAASPYGAVFGGMGASLLPSKFVSKPIVVGSAALGALAVGALGYSFGGLKPKEKVLVRDEFQSKMERKYSDRIDQIEGWHD